MFKVIYETCGELDHTRLMMSDVFAQMCLFSIGHWLNLDPDAGLWVRVQYECVARGWGEIYRMFAVLCEVAVLNTAVASSLQQRLLVCCVIKQCSGS